jgi:FkbM family methyltransferase
MKLNKGEIKGIKFYYREGMSDKKTFDEVLGKEVYLKKGMIIQVGETWMDCGGNVGAFTLLACSKGAKVTVYEPDPFNCEMIKKNLELNGFSAEVKQAALVHNDTKEIILFIGNNGNVWRNSIVKKWNNKGIKVPCLNFDVEAKNFDCCKMDIEGAEMLILENTNKVFKKLVYEWSFDIDGSLNRFRKVVDNQKQIYNKIDISDKRYYELADEHIPKRFIVPCTNVFCYEKN